MMAASPPKWLEKVAGAVIPPACREEVLGDLHERYRSPAQYLGDLFSTLPFLILSRIRRGTDLQSLLMEALVVYGSFLAVAWYFDEALLRDSTGMLRLALPALLTLSYLLLFDAFSSPSGRASWRRYPASMIAVVAFYLLGFLSKTNIYGFGISLVLVSGMRAILGSVPTRTPSAGAALLPNSDAGSVKTSRTAKIAQDVGVTVLCLAVAAGLIVVLPRAAFAVIGALTWAVAYRILKDR